MATQSSTLVGRYGRARRAKVSPARPSERNSRVLLRRHFVTRAFEQQPWLRARRAMLPVGWRPVIPSRESSSGEPLERSKPPRSGMDDSNNHEQADGCRTIYQRFRTFL
ncbi:hypothetical protein MTO96_009702 [Rhipicephalus appendiculatus]